MDQRTLDINVISARDLKDVKFFSKMDVYAVVSISDYGSKQKPKQKTKTPIAIAGGKDPTWNFPIKFTIPEIPLAENRLNLVFELKCERALCDNDLGEVNVPIKGLLDSAGDGKSVVTYQVMKPSGKPKGEISFSFKFGVTEKVEFSGASSAPAKATNYNNQPVTAYPTVPGVGPGSVPYGVPAGSYPPPHGGCPPPSPPFYGHPAPGHGYPPFAANYNNQPVTAYPPVLGVGPSSVPYGGPGSYPPPLPGYEYPTPPPYGGYPPPSPPGHGYPLPGYGYPPVRGGYGYPPPVQNYF